MVFSFNLLQDDSYLESYISTIGVDFVSIKSFHWILPESTSMILE